MDRLESLSNGCEVYENEEYLETVSVKQEPTTDEEVLADIPLDCLLCAKKLHTISGLKAHVIAHHNYKSVKRKCGDCASPDKSATKRLKHDCTTCGRSFVTSTDLKVHETCHNKFCCFACNAKFNSFKEVSQHRRRCKMKNAETTAKPKTLTDILNERKATKQSEKSGETTKQECVKCLKCTDSFQDDVSYKIHRILQHGEKDGLENINQKIEIEIDNVKQEPIANDQKDANSLDAQVDKDDKEKVDYAKIETELESIFDIAVEKRQIHITILENETDDSSGSADKGVEREDDQKTIEDILKSPVLSQVSQIESSTTKDSNEEENNKQQVDTAESKEGSHADSIPTEISVKNNGEGTSKLSKEDLSEETERSSPNFKKRYTDGRNSEQGSNKENDTDEINCEKSSNKENASEAINAKGPIDTTESTNGDVNNFNDNLDRKPDTKGPIDTTESTNEDVNNFNDNLDRKPDTSHTNEIEPAEIDNAKTIEEQDKENEKPGQNSDNEIVNDVNNDVNIKIVTIEQSAIGKTLNSAIKSTDFNEKEENCDEIANEEVLKGVNKSEPIGESIEK